MQFTTSTTRARILIADDDPVSLHYLESALVELGCEATSAANGGAALAACQVQQFDLLLLDRRMPDFGGAVLLHRLRENGVATIAIATSAELDAAQRRELHAAGYLDTLTKPIGIAALAQMLVRHLAHHHALPKVTQPAVNEPAATIDDAVLHDIGALVCVGGDAQTLRALRNLLLNELHALPRNSVALMQMPALRDYLHRLRASCRYCGAAVLGSAAAKLETALREPGDVTTQSQEFIHAVAQTTTVLETQSAPSP